uniref:acetyl-CoA carboxytransferase n=1 Tax=Juglans regia TaxID=51240 RepID=A0A343J2B7_JUGRE|nr:acetyl-CoA carboxylase submit alpha-CT [Juglans regia]
MASITHSPAAFVGASASDLLRSSSNGVSGVPLRTLGRGQFGARRRDFAVVAKIRKVKKHEHPWPDNADPNVKGGVLSHLSHFKPLKEKPKPVTLEFERPLLDLEKKIIDVRKMANETGLDFSDQIISLENKYQQALKDLYTHLTPIQRVNIARHPNRPTFLDHVFSITEKFVELHGDRAGYDDPAIVTGIGTIDGRRYMFMGHQKGRNTKENIQRNFGMPTPHGYRKALRMMYYADHHGLPIVTFIDTPGAYADIKSEELGQGEAIAHNLRTMFGLKVPIVSIVIGEGGSGGALAIGCANKLLMLENAVFYVASPEACAAILWKSAKAAPKAAERLKITATELCRLQIADGIIPEPLGGAHADPSWSSKQIKKAINESMDELMKMDTQDLLKHRMLKFRKIGGFQEGLPVDPKKKVNMKKKDEPIRKTSDQNIEDEVKKLMQRRLDAKEPSVTPPRLGLAEMMEKLRREVDREFSEVVKTIGLKDRLVMLREEFSKVNSQDQLVHPALKDKIEKLRDELNQGLSAAPNYERLKHKLDMLKELSKTKSLAEKNNKAAALKQEINRKFTEVTNRSDIKEKFRALKAEIEISGASTVMDLDYGLREKVMKVKRDIELELVDAFKALDLDVEVVKSKAKELSEQETSFSDVKVKIGELNEEIKEGIENVIKSSDLKDKIELLKLEVAKAGKTPGPVSKNRIAALEQQIKQSLAGALDSSNLKEKHEKLKAEISKTIESSGGLDGSLNGQYLREDGSSTYAEPRVEIGANSTFA